jgi:hypothetical protein
MTEPYSCALCDEKYEDMDSVIRHIITEHRVNKLSVDEWGIEL